MERAEETSPALLYLRESGLSRRGSPSPRARLSPICEEPALCGNHGNGERYVFAAHLQRAAHSAFQTAAAGNLHARDAYGADGIGGKDLRKLFRVIDGVEFGAANQRDATADEVGVEVAIGEGGAVGGIIGM